MNVTDHELLTRELRRREAYLAEAQRLSHTASFGWNISTGEIFWSDETFRILEFAPSSKISLQMILKRVHPQAVPSVEMAIAGATRGEGIDLENRLLRPSGSIKYLHVVGKTDWRETGGIDVIGAVMDVTRQENEIELRRGKAHLADAQRLGRTGGVGMEVSTSLQVEYFIDRYARKAGKNIENVGKKTLQSFQSYPWPGNIRELQNVIEQSVILCETTTLSVDVSWLFQPPRDCGRAGKLRLSESLTRTR